MSKTHRELIPREKQRIKKLIVSKCASYDKEYGCLPLDCECPIFGICFTNSALCTWFRDAVLKIYQNGESVKIADDVHDYSVMADGRILYLYDYSLNYSKGELHIWENGETRKIDDDVVCVIPVYETKYRGYNYGR